MEDLVLREIELIGTVLRAILSRLGLMRNAGEGGPCYGVAAGALREELGISLDDLLDRPDAADILAARGFDDVALEKFAEVLYMLAVSSPEESARRRCARCAVVLYDRLEESGTTCFYDRYYIRQELERYL